VFENGRKGDNAQEWQKQLNEKESRVFVFGGEYKVTMLGKHLKT